jgi:hypothetical protein
MKKFYFTIPEMHITKVTIEADDLDEALTLVKAGNSAHSTTEFDHRHDASTWTVHDENGDVVATPRANVVSLKS